MRDKSREGKSHGSTSKSLKTLGDVKEDIDFYNECLKLAKEVQDKGLEGEAYSYLGNAYQTLCEFKKAIDYYILCLKITKELGDKRREGCAYGSIGNAYLNLGEFKTAIDYHNLALNIMKEVRDKPEEANVYCNLGIVHERLGEFKTAIDYQNLSLNINKEEGDKRGEGQSYGNLGCVYQSLGEFKTAINFHKESLKISKETGNKHGESCANGNLGLAYESLGEFKTAINHHNLALKISKEVGDKHGEGETYCNLGNVYQKLGEFKTSVDYYNLNLTISKEVGDKYGEGTTYGNLGNAYRRLGDLQRATECHSQHLKIALEVWDKTGEAAAYFSLALVFEIMGQLPKAVEHHEASVTVFNYIRRLLKSKDEWKVNFRNQFQIAFTGLWRVLVKQGNIVEALFAADKGRAQALTDLMESSFCDGESQPEAGNKDLAALRYIPSNTVFKALDSPEDTINFWVLLQGGNVQFRQDKLDLSSSFNGDTQSFESLVRTAHVQLEVRSNVTCENRCLDALRENRDKVDEKSEEESSQPRFHQDNCLRNLYNIIIQPVADLLLGDELVIVPDGPLWLAPYAAFLDGDSKYLCESFRIRLIPSLTSLRLISECPDDFHRRSGALLVGDPCLAEITNSQGEKMFEQLPFAKMEVEMIGQILDVAPITGEKATKREVLKRLSSVALVHFAAHGCIETGEITLTPNPERGSTAPAKEDFILTIGDALNAKLRAKLVVLSCCHSGRGEIKAEGVVGIARAFMGAGARSVLVSLWAIDDEATLEFMRCFYNQLVEGRSASESLNLAMKSLRESDKYSDIKYWAPFVLIGDDVTLDLNAKE